jgi:nuclear pore complex protein Nup188
MASEANSLGLISHVLDRYREAGASAGIDTQAIQPLKWDKVQVQEDIEELLGRRSVLRARIVATSEKEMEWTRKRPLSSSSGAENRLEEKVVNQMKATLACLKEDS